MRAGKIIPHDVKPASHELDTILFFTNLGKNVELIQPSNTPHNKRADFLMDGIEWEMKAPIGKGRHTIEHIFKKSAHQAENMIIDLRRTSLRDKESSKILLRLFKTSRSIKRLWIISKTEELTKFEKNRCYFA